MIARLPKVLRQNCLVSRQAVLLLNKEHEMYKKIRNIMTFFVVIAIAMESYFSVSALAILPNTYYVSVDGNDANTCTQSASCNTIKRGMSVAQSGDTVIVSAGVYHEYVYVDKSITIISNGATVDGVNASGSVTDGLISVVASNVKLQGFTISNAKTYGLANFGNNNQFVNNVIHHTQGAGIWMRDGKFNTFEGNELYDTVLQNSVSFNGTSYTCNPNATAWPSAINSWGAASSNTWRNNNIHDNCGEGIVTIAGDLVENNTFKNNWSVEIYIANNGSVVRNNTIIDTKPYTPRGSDQSWRNVPAGISIGDEVECLSDNNTIAGNSITGARYGVSFYSYISCSGIKNSLIENNTILNAWEYGLRILAGAHTNSIIRNNIIQLTSGKPLTIQNGGIAMTGNLFFSNVNVFEWNGTSYNFTAWNNIVPGNFWGTDGTGTTTFTPTPTAQVAPIPTMIPPTSTATVMASPIPPTNTPTSNPTFQPTATVNPIINYDDLNKALIYSSSWKKVSNRQAYGGSYKTTTKAGSAISLKFTGQSFSILYVAGPSYGNVNVYIDGKLMGTINQKTVDTRFQQRWDYSGNLSAGSHVLKLVTSNTSSTYVSFDAVIVR